MSICKLSKKKTKKKRGHYFYNQVDHKVFVSINGKFLEKDYMVCNKTKYDINRRNLEDIPIIAQKTIGTKVFALDIPDNSSI